MSADDRCPRCGDSFHCGMNDAAPCACSRLALDPVLLADLRTRYTGCLCMRCLAALAAQPPSGPSQSAPWPPLRSR
jgi:hypothetical protein